MSRKLTVLLSALLLLWPIFASADSNLNVSVSGNVRDTLVTFIGYASPSAFVTFQEDGSIVGTASANSSGVFNKTLTARTSGTHSYGIYAFDSSSRVTPTYGFILNLASRAETVVSNILLPTTIDVNVGSGVNVFGSSAPSSQITIFVHSNPITGTTTSGSNGDWSFPVGVIEPGSHTASAQATLPGGLQSISSNTINFDVNCKTADSDCSGKVDMVDFSILMYYWGTSSPRADVNNDGIVDLTDFSIMMYYWNG